MFALIVSSILSVGIAGTDALSVHELTGTLQVGQDKVALLVAGTEVQLVFPESQIEWAARRLDGKTVRIEGVRCAVASAQYVMVNGVGPAPKK